MSTILLADDSLTIQKVVELTFADTSYTVVAVSSGEDLLEKLPECLPDLVICDVIMPGKDGYEVCQEIKSTPATLHIPVILLTGTFEPFDRDRALAAGCSEIITKPFEARKLVDTVEELLGGAAPAEAPATEEGVPTQFDATTPAGFEMPSEPPAPVASEPEPPMAEPGPAEGAKDGLDFTTSGFAEMEAAAVDEHELVPEAPQEGLEFDLGGEQPPEPPVYDTAPVEPVPSPETQPVMMPEVEELPEPEVEFAELPDEPPQVAEGGEVGARADDFPPTVPTFEPAPPGIEPEAEYELPIPEPTAAAEPVEPAESFELPEPAEPPAFAGAEPPAYAETEAATSFELPEPIPAPMTEPPAYEPTLAEAADSFELPAPEPTVEAEPSVPFEAAETVQAEIPAFEPEPAPPEEDTGAPSIPAFEAEPPRETEAGPAMPFEMPPSAEPVAEAMPAMPFELPQPEAEPAAEAAIGLPDTFEADAIPTVEEPVEPAAPAQPEMEEPPLVFEPAEPEPMQAEPEVDAFPPPPMEAAPAEVEDAFAAPAAAESEVFFEEAPPAEQDSAEVAFPPPPMEADEEQVFEEPPMPPPAEPTTDIFAAPPSEPAVEPVGEAFPAPPAEPPAAEPAAPVSNGISDQEGAGLSDADVDRIARRVLELSGGKIEEIAWEVIPDMAEIVVRERVRELESSAGEGSETIQ
jgi:CheY-like chemotaxis protein